MPIPNSALQHQVVVIVGASGGLGRAISAAFQSAGATLALVARQPISPPTTISTYQADLTDRASLQAACDAILADHGHIDIVVNATGVDVRRAFLEHTPADIDRTIAVNLHGAITLTHVFMPAMTQGVIAHLGGFADGRLAFPFYAADVASRAGVAAFAEALNRELRLLGQDITVLYFSPAPADTPAEQPFHPLWRAMGLRIATPEQVASELLAAIKRRRQRYIMGGPLNRLISVINAAAPALADALALHRYGQQMRSFFSGQPVYPTRQSSLVRWIAILLIIASFILYGALFAIPFLPVNNATKVALAPTFIVMGEATFWVGGALIGQEVLRRYRRFLNPINWFAACRPNA